MALTVLKALLLAGAFYCFAYTVTGLAASLLKSGPRGRSVTVVFAEGDCEGVEEALRAAAVSGTAAILYADGLSEAGKRFVEAAKRAFPSVPVAESADEAAGLLARARREGGA